MKKILSVILTAAILFTALTVFSTAADTEFWSVYAKADTYDDPDNPPHIPGYKYTDMGIQLYTVENLDALGWTCYGTLQTTEPQDYTKGITMTVTADEFEDNAGTDKWICFTLWDRQGFAQGTTEYGHGWRCYIRPAAATVVIQSYMCTETDARANLEQYAANVNVYDGEAMTLEVKRLDDGKYHVFVCDVDMGLAATTFTDFTDNGKVYVGVTGYSGSAHPMKLTVVEYNGEKPTGTSSAIPYSPDNAPVTASKEDTPPVPENEPCYIYNADSVKNGVPGGGMTSTVNDDGSLHIKFDKNNPQIETSLPADKWYDAGEFPVFTVKFKGLDEFAEKGMLWYCSGDVMAAQQDSMYEFDWSVDCSDEAKSDDGWKLLVIDLSDEDNWGADRRINGFRFDLAADGSLDGKECDIEWLGFFRSVKEACAYGKMEYSEATATASEETTEKATTDAAATDSDKKTEDTEKDETTDPLTSIPYGEEGKKDYTTLIIVIVCVAAVICIAVAVVIAVKKKRK